MAGFGRSLFNTKESANEILMTVTNTPSMDLALTNCAYCSSVDYRKFYVQSLGQALASVGPSMVLTLQFHENIKDGEIALNAIQRRHAKVSARDTIPVSRCVPPENNFKLVLLTLELEFVKARGKSEQLDAVLLDEQLHKRFQGQISSLFSRWGRGLHLNIVEQITSLP